MVGCYEAFLPLAVLQSNLHCFLFTHSHTPQSFLWLHWSVCSEGDKSALHHLMEISAFFSYGWILFYFFFFTKIYTMLGHYAWNINCFKKLPIWRNTRNFHTCTITAVGLTSIVTNFSVNVLPRAVFAMAICLCTYLSWKKTHALSQLLNNSVCTFIFCK